MKAKLSKSLVDKLPFTQSGRIMYTDTLLNGFGLRIGKSKKVYYAEKRVNGKPVRVTIGEHGQITTEVARDEAKRMLGLMSGHSAINPNEERSKDRVKGIALLEAFDEFKSSRGYLKDRTMQDYEYAMRLYFHDWKGKALSSITREMVESKHKWIGNGHGGEAQANQAMRFLRSIFNFAIGRYGRAVISENPVEGLSLTRSWFRVERKQTLLKPHELPSLFEALDNLVKNDPSEYAETVSDYVLLLLCSGLRRLEAIKLTWDRVDFKDRSFSILDTKNRVPFALPLSDFLFDLLQARWQRRSSDYVFPGKRPNSHLVEPKRHLNKIMGLSGLSFSPHDLRRTFITIAESLDIPYYALKRLVNHKIGSDITSGYIVHDVDRLRKPMQQITIAILRNAKALPEGKVIALSGRG